MAATRDIHNETDILSSENRLKAMLKVEAALGWALAKSSIITDAQADSIADACNADTFDVEAIETAGARAGTPVIPLVKELVKGVQAICEDASRFVHFGATSQDVMDTATVLLLREAVEKIEKNLAITEIAFDALALKHGDTAMLGRTLLQPGPPVSFGLKVAGWSASVTRGRKRIREAADKALLLQFGGAVGNLSSLGDKGLEVSRHLAAELELPLPDAPWHVHRDRLVELASAIGILVGSLGKIARDISLQMQSEVAELSEPAAPGKGGSSAMPHKRNPVGCMHVLAAATRTPGLVSSLLSAMPQEHERGLGGWQSEWPSLRDLFTEAFKATAAMVEITNGLEVDATRMGVNLEATHEIVFSERLSAALIPKLGRLESQKLVAGLVKQSVDENRKLSKLATDNAAIQSCLKPEGLAEIFDPQRSLGESSELIRRLLDSEKD